MTILLLILFIAALIVFHYRRGLRFILAYLDVLKVADKDIEFKETLHYWKNGQKGRIHQYSPAKRKPTSVIIFVTGISRDGIHDIRLITLARALAHSGKAVFLGEFTEFSTYKMKGSESEKLLETVAFAKERYPKLKYGIGSVCLGGIVSLIALTKMQDHELPSYIYLHGIFLDHDEMVRHTCKATPFEDKAPLSYATLPPDPFGKAVILYNSENFINSLTDGKKGAEVLLNYIRTVKDSDSHLEFRQHMNALCKSDIDKITGRIEPELLCDVDRSSPREFLASYDIPTTVKLFQSHTKDDDVIPLSQGLDMFYFLRDKGANMRFALSDMGHGGEVHPVTKGLHQRQSTLARGISNHSCTNSQPRRFGDGVESILGQLHFLKFTLDWSNY